MQGYTSLGSSSLGSLSSTRDSIFSRISQREAGLSATSLTETLSLGDVSENSPEYVWPYVSELLRTLYKVDLRRIGWNNPTHRDHHEESSEPPRDVFVAIEFGFYLAAYAIWPGAPTIGHHMNTRHYDASSPLREAFGQLLSSATLSTLSFSLPLACRRACRTLYTVSCVNVKRR